MAVYKRGNTWWYEFVFNGERIRASTKQSNKRVAEQMEAAEKTRLAKGEVGIVERKPVPTLREFAPRFTAAIETLCANKPATIKFYKGKLKALLAHEPFASSKLDQIEEAAIEQYKRRRSQEITRRKLPRSPASVNRELATLRRLLNLAHEWKVIARVPKIRLLRGERHREFVLDYDQEELYLATAPTDLRDLAVLMLDTGLRVGEALSLQWPQVHLEPAGAASLGYARVLASVSKNSKQRNVPLTGRVAEMLRRLGPQKEGYVFHRDDGSPLYQTWLNQRHAKLRKLLKLPVEFVPHSLRHTFGTRLGEAGADAFTIMKLMGHCSVVVSQRYVHPTPETMEEALDRLQALNRENREKRSKVPTNLPTPENLAIGDGNVTN